MTEPPRGVRRRPGSAPRTEVLDAVVREGRRRQRRAASWTAGTAVVAIGLAVLSTSLGGPSGNDALVPADRRPAVSPAPFRSTSPVPSGIPSPIPTRARASALAGSAPVATPAAAASPSPTGGGVTPPALRPYRETPERTNQSQYCDAADALAGTPPGTQVCASTSSAPLVESGGHLDVSLMVCNSLSSRSSATLDYGGGREHDVSVTVGAEAVWTWSRGYTFPQGAHSRVLPPGDCLRWTTTWTTRDDEGRLVPPGKYYVRSVLEIEGASRRFTTEVEVQPRQD